LAGEVLTAALPATAAGMTLIGGDVEGLSQLARTAVATAGVTYALKYAVDAERPNGGERSFPSGHTSLSFCSAEYLRRRYGPSLGMPAYAAAAFVGYSRVQSGEHYAGDVLAGAVIGAAAAWAFTHPMDGAYAQVEAAGGFWRVVVGRVW
jgi:membrane-associated phospholipid phosphatase